MHDDAIPTHVIAFIVDHISSVIHLEVLLLLHAHRDRAFSADELGRELRVNADWAGSQAQSLCEKGILGFVETMPRRYQFRPATADFERTVEDLANVYAERRVTVITLIFNKPVDQAQSFADAFRIRRDGGHG